ncbi:MAG: hypothetical protein U9Q62_03045 [Campylobacterota bacterium]|nr:hypothetical protein [Campylobacterota bacterium]
MRYILFVLTAILFISGCSSKNIRVSGMICPPGHSEQMVHSDFRECRAYDEKEAEAATYPKTLEGECKECLLKRGYKIDE